MKTPFPTETVGSAASLKTLMPISGKKECSLYFHIPFCKKKCPYCHFYVIPNRTLHREVYLQALLREWEAKLPLLQGYTLASVYFGGGTPSLFPEAAKEILSRIKFPLADTFECTLEANPEDITLPLIQEAKEYGINRVSMGVQSLSNSSLAVLERGHERETSLKAIELINQGGIKNISIDLMYDLPNQTLQDFEETLLPIKNLPITHLSLYNLTIEPHTVFFKRRKELQPLLPSAKESYKMLKRAVDLLADFGFERYEISAFMKNELYSHHNTGYWTRRPFLGFGPSAFSYWEGRRFQNTPHLLRYANCLEKNQDPVHFSEELSPEEKQKELFAVQLRLLEGIELSLFEEKLGPLSSTLQRAIETLKKEGFLELSGKRIALTEKGLLFHDTVAEALF